MTRFRRVLAVANPAAGLRAGRDAGEAAARGARDAGARVELARTTGPGDAERLAARAASEGIDLVLAVGGDGTAHEAANGLAGSRTALGVAPAGTMNLLARILALPLDPESAARTIVARPRVAEIRPGAAGGRLFLLMLGAGFDAWVLRDLLAARRGKIGFGDYIRGAVGALRRFPFSALRVEADGVPLEGHTAIVGRAPLYGGFLRPTPRADLLEPRFDVCVFRGGGADLARSLPALWSGAHAGGALTRAATRVRITGADGEVPYQLDGELTGSLPVEAAISDRILRLAR